MTAAKYISDAQLAHILQKVYELTDSVPVITMGAAAALHAGRSLKVGSDIDVLISPYSPIFLKERYTQSSDGVYRGYKRVIDIGGVIVELLGDLVANVPCDEGINGTRAIKFQHYPIISGTSLSDPSNGVTQMVALTPMGVLADFYSSMNRPKDKEKVEQLLAAYRRIHEIPPVSLIRAEGIDKVYTWAEMLSYMIQQHASSAYDNFSLWGLDSDGQPEMETGGHRDQEEPTLMMDNGKYYFAYKSTAGVLRCKIYLNDGMEIWYDDAQFVFTGENGHFIRKAKPNYGAVDAMRDARV